VEGAGLRAQSAGHSKQLHQHYNELLSHAGAIIFGRITYQLMENSWPPIVKKPTDNKPIDEFAVIIQKIPKIVFSRTLTNVEWENAKLAKKGLKEEVSELRQQSGRDILVGNPGLILALMKLNLIDQYQLCVHPVITGSGYHYLKT
jgi:dihydrofolate reductase